MKGKSLYIVSAIIIALPWIFLMEILPIPYDRIGTLTEIVIECTMFTSLLIVASLLRKDLKRQKQLGGAGRGANDAVISSDGSVLYHNGGLGSAGGKRRLRSGRGMRSLGRLLIVIDSLTIFVVGLVLLLIGISYSV